MPDVSNFSETRNSLVLLRIPFSIFLLPVFLLALSQSPEIDLTSTLISFFIIHFLVYPASNGYNSFIDQDESSIGGLERPPKAGRQLFFITVAMDLLALVLAAAFINLLFSFCLLLYILASRAYSAPWPRLKRFPVAGFFTVVLFQGAFTYIFSRIGIEGTSFFFSEKEIWLLVAASLQIAGAYPLTQVYQHGDDRKAGITTLSYRLGIMGTFIFTSMMFVLCNVCYFMYFKIAGQLFSFLILQLFFLPIVLFFGWWIWQVKENKNKANFRNTMRMNTIASVSMSVCFIILFIRQHP